MRLRRREPRRARLVLVVASAMFVMMPTAIGLQDIASLLAQQPFVSERVRQNLFVASTFGTIHAATYEFARPIGTEVPQVPEYTLASLALREPEEQASPRTLRLLGIIGVAPKRVFPTVNRTAKGDRLLPAPPPSATRQPDSAPAPGAESTKTKDESAPTARPAELRKSEAAPAGVPEPQMTTASLPGPREKILQPKSEQSAARSDEAEPDSGTPEFNDDNPTTMTARIYFDTAPLGGQMAAIEPWAPGAAPVVEPVYINDPDLKRFGRADDPADTTAGETIAGKGEVTGAGKRPKSPAERLGLSGAGRAKSEKCLTDAIYFEARGEAVNGQIAVAQVVLNRVFSGFYPSTVCGVVYQNAHRHLACQFTFACDGIPDRVTEPEAWERAKEIARETLDGKLWLKQVGKSTHYHAYWVHPSWVREMMKMDRLGVHTFYRPRAWGDGSDAPVWGDPVATAEASKNL
ncbi:MAG: cell wall hydrolase [Xanthobacteraceae bacterium]